MTLLNYLIIIDMPLLLKNIVYVLICQCQFTERRSLDIKIPKMIQNKNKGKEDSLSKSQSDEDDSERE